MPGNTGSGSTDSLLEQGLEGGERRWPRVRGENAPLAPGLLNCCPGPGGETPGGQFQGDEPWNLTARENPCRAGTPWTPPARNRAGRPSEEESVERVRNPVGGTYPVLASRGGVDSLGLMRRRGRELHERCRTRSCGQLSGAACGCCGSAGRIGLHPEVGATAGEEFSGFGCEGGRTDGIPEGAAAS